MSVDKSECLAGAGNILFWLDNVDAAMRAGDGKHDVAADDGCDEFSLDVDEISLKLS